MTSPLQDRVAIVTGAGSGLGKAHAITLAGLGASVLVNEVPDGAAKAEAVCEVIAAAGGSAQPALFSVSDPEAGNDLVAAALKSFGRLDIVVNNAGILRSAALPELDDENWQRHLAVHLDGAFRLTRSAWPHLVGQRFGRIIFTTSSAGLFGAFGLAAYGAAKMGLVGLMRVLAVEAGESGVLVNAIAPLAWTPMSQAGGRTGSAAQALGDSFEQFLPEHVSAVVAMLSHPDCPAQGQILAVGGGRVAEIAIAETRGYTAAAPTVEELLENWDRIRDRADVAYPMSLKEELTLYSERVPS